MKNLKISSAKLILALLESTLINQQQQMQAQI